MRKIKSAKNRGRITHNKGSLNKAVLDGNLSREQKKFLASNGIKPEGATPLGRMEVLLFSENENGDIVSYFDDTQLAINRANTTLINKDELWICVVETGADNTDYAQPLQEITPEQILEMDGKIETLSKFVWKNNPEEVVEHLGVSKDILRLEEIESDFEKLRKESDDLRSEIEERDFNEDSIRSEIEDEFKEAVKKIEKEHQLVLTKLKEDHGKEEKKTRKEMDDLNKKIKKLEKRDNDEEVQRLNEKISELEKENEDLVSRNEYLESWNEDLESRGEELGSWNYIYKAEMDQKVEELNNENLNNSSFYEGTIENLNERLRILESETTNLEEINKTLREDLKESRREANEKADELTTVRNTLSEYYENENRTLKDELEKYKRELELLSDKPESSEEIHDLHIHLESKTHEAAMLTRKVEDLDRRNRVLTDMLEHANNGDSSNDDSVGTTARQKQNSMAGSVIRISADEFKCTLIDEGTYSARINADRTIMRFVPDPYGNVRCRNGIIYVPDLNMIEVLGNKFGELKWKIINENTLEVSI